MAHCTGYGNCKQGRNPCQTAWACNVRTECGGESVDTSAIEDGQSMFASGWFWLSGAASVAVWAVIAIVVGLAWGLWAAP